MRSVKKHLLFSVAVFGGWLVFLLIGMPSYFTEWKNESKILLLLVWISVTAPQLVFFILSQVRGDHFSNSIILAVYATLGGLLLDVLYLSFTGGTWISFPRFPLHWIQIAGYAATAIEFPVIGFMMRGWERKKRAVAPAV